MRILVAAHAHSHDAQLRTIAGYQKLTEHEQKMRAILNTAVVQTDMGRWHGQGEMRLVSMIEGCNSDVQHLFLLLCGQLEESGNDVVCIAAISSPNVQVDIGLVSNKVDESIGSNATE